MFHTGLIIGLGNAGKSFAYTRHNLGYRIVDSMARRYAAGHWFKFFDSLSCYASTNPFLLVKPQGLMGNCGKVVKLLLKNEKVPLRQILVIHDDLSLPAGQTLLKYGGGSAGHNGVQSIDDEIGSEYWRLRIGIGSPLKRDPASIREYVLEEFSSEENEWLNRLLDAVELGET